MNKFTNPFKLLVCGDKDVSCGIIRSMSSSDRTTICNDGYSSLCPLSCQSCTPTEAERCANFKDDEYKCETRDCDDSDLLEQHRVRKNCPKTCCSKNQLFSDELSQLDDFHPRLLSLNMHS